MSNHLAVATVTAALKTLLSRAVHVVPGAQVSSVRPDAIGKDGLIRGVNVFLYLASINPSFENQDTPMRRADGTAVAVPCTPLDLDYLITFYGDDAMLEPQILLASTFAVLRRQPVLNTALIHDAITGVPVPDLSASNLADQLPRVTVTPHRLDVDLLHKLWPNYQCPYILSAAFRASVVLVHSDVVPRVAGLVREVDVTIDTGKSREIVKSSPVATPPAPLSPAPRDEGIEPTAPGATVAPETPETKDP
jgi:hypothetical protein